MSKSLEAMVDRAKRKHPALIAKLLEIMNTLDEDERKRKHKNKLARDRYARAKEKG